MHQDNNHEKREKKLYDSLRPGIHRVLFVKTSLSADRLDEDIKSAGLSSDLLRFVLHEYNTDYRNKIIAGTVADNKTEWQWHLSLIIIFSLNPPKDRFVDQKRNHDLIGALIEQLLLYARAQ